MSNKTKVLIALTFIMMVMVYQIGETKGQNGALERVVTNTQPQVTEVLAQGNTEEVVTQQPEAVELVSDSTVRIRIIPSSNKYEDQQAKKLVRYAVDEFLTENQSYLTDINSTREFIATNITVLENKVAHVLNSISYPEGFKLTYGAHLFPEKELNGVVYEEGYYESLVITIGDGTGSNWWCFMNADLCMGPSMTKQNETDSWNAQYNAMSATQDAFQEKEFKSFFGEMFSKMFKSDDDNQVNQAFVSGGNNEKSNWYLYEDEY